MYTYSYDEETGGILLNTTPTVFSKEPRPVYADELNLLGFDKYWNYVNQSDTPYMWAESAQYIYRGKPVAKLKGGSLYDAPEIVLAQDDNGNVVEPEPNGGYLRPIDIPMMINKNREIMEIIESSTVKKILAIYEKYKNKLDIFHVAFSGGKDSEVLLDLVRKTLPKKSFVVVFGDTGMEFPDTYEAVEETKKMCEKEDVPFFTSNCHFEPNESWHLFGPPARVLRWCCSVHKSAPQTRKLREITGKNNYVGLDFVGVRKHESTARSEYDYENFGKKQKGQYSHNSILDWTSAEIWLYLYMYNLPINKAYKKGNSRAGCLFCPMGGGKGDYIQRKSYPEEIQVYIDMIKEMNARNKGDEVGLTTYITNGGWNARKNGRDLTINEKHYDESVKGGKLILTVTNPKTDWLEWIKTLGEIPFEYNYEETKDGYRIIAPAYILKKYPKVAKKFKQVFKKSAYCVGCRVCESNCPNGCISFENGLKIVNCIHCGQCHEIDDGCLAYHSLRTSLGENGKMNNASINSFANHAPKLEWVREFFDMGNEYWELNSLGPNQVPMFKRFLRDTGLIDKNNKTTKLFDVIVSIGWESGTAWGLIASNFAYNPQFNWYINNLDVGTFYQRDTVSDLLINDGVKKNDATSIINAFKRFCELPLGTVLNWGAVYENGRQIDSLYRNKCAIVDNRVILYSLLLFVENCDENKEFTLSWLMDELVDRNGVSPSKVFGLDYEEMKSALMGLSQKYPDFIIASFTNDLDKISILQKKSEDVISLFEEEM